MKRAFAKLHGLGNDFIFLDDREDALELTPEEVKALCDRHKGIGADGVIIVKPSPRPGCAAFMHYINSDGTLAQMCGNGVRCFAKFLVDRAIVDPASGSLIADTPAGERTIDFSVDDENHLIEATVNMGTPILDPKAIPVDAVADAEDRRVGAYVRALALASPWATFTFTCVSMGNPHAVCFIDDWSSLPGELFSDPAHPSLETFDVSRVGAHFEAHPVFPERANIEFVQPGPDGLAMRVFERGCGETLACGTGACATLVAAVLNDLSPNENTVRLRGGALRIRWNDDLSVSMRGRAEESFTGEVDLAACETL